MNFAFCRRLSSTSGDFRLWRGLSENKGVTTFQAAAFQNAQGLASATIRSGESLPECASYETKNARISVCMVLAALVPASELEPGNSRVLAPRIAQRRIHSPALGSRAWFRSVTNLEAHLAGGAGDDAESGFVVARIQVFRLRLYDVHHLLACYFTNLNLVRFF